MERKMIMKLAALCGAILGVTLKHGKGNLMSARDALKQGVATSEQQRMVSDMLEGIIDSIVDD